MQSPSSCVRRHLSCSGSMSVLHKSLNNNNVPCCCSAPPKPQDGHTVPRPHTVHSQGENLPTCSDFSLWQSSCLLHRSLQAAFRRLYKCMVVDAPPREVTKYLR